MERKTASEFDPQLLSLFHKYVHGGINRREFLDGAAKFAVGGMTAMGLWETLRPNYAWAQQVPKDDKRIKAEYTFYSSPKGNAADGKMRGLLARPASGDKFPVVVVIHENRGLNPYIEDVARRLAASGFMALAPDAIWPLGGYPSVDKYGAEADEKASACRSNSTAPRSPKTSSPGRGVLAKNIRIPPENSARSVSALAALWSIDWPYGCRSWPQEFPSMVLQPAAGDVPKIKAALLVTLPRPTPISTAVAGVRNRPQSEWH